MIKKINKKYLLLLLICLCVSCNNSTNSKQKFISDNFLKIVDTTAYRKGAFITNINDTLGYYSELSVRVSPEIKYSTKMNEIANVFFENNKELKNQFKDVIKNNSNNDFTLNSNFKKKIGNYNLFFDDVKKDMNIKYAGKIDIQNFMMLNNKAFLILTESVGKQGRTFIVLLIKNKNNWVVYKKSAIIYT